MPRASAERLVPEFGEFDPVPAPNKELPAQIGLELLQPPGQCRLAHVQVLGGIGDRTGIGHGNERPQQDEIHTCDFCMKS